MQMDSKDKLRVSTQMGCGASHLAMGPICRELGKACSNHVVGEYFNSLEYLSVFLRISGELTDFGGEGPERLKYSKRWRFLTIDLVIPQPRWRNADTEMIREYLAQGVEQCFEQLVTRAQKMDELVDESALRADFEVAMKEFLASAE